MGRARICLHGQSKEINERIEEIQRSVLNAPPFHFVLRRAESQQK